MKALSRWSALVFAILIFNSLPVKTQQPSQTLVGHVPHVVLANAVKPVGPLPLTQRLNLSIVLPLRNQDQLTSLLSRLYDPSSPDYHHFLSVAQFTEQFGPTAQDFQAVVDYVEANGMKVSSRPANRVVVPINGTTEQIQKAFQVAMKFYPHPTENRAYYSADREPSLALNVPIAHIAGLNNFSIPHAMVLKGPVERSLISTAVQGSGPGGEYLPSDMRAAYYGGTALTGAGQTVALLQFDGYDIADVIADLNGAATADTDGSNYVLNYTETGSGTSYRIPVNNVLLDGATGQSASNDDAEEALDIAQVVGMAPGVSQIRVYIGNSDIDILNAIASENLAKQVSISWTWAPDDPATDDAVFEEFAAQGQSVFVASGDYGAFSPSFASYYPAEDDWVTSVGGTHLSTNGAGGTWNSETTWTRGGGGISPDNIPIPGWQAGIATSSNQGSNTFRNVPDIAMEADFDNYTCSMGICSGGYAGTSFASPRWAGFMALLNQQAVANGGSTMGFFNVNLYGVAEGSEYGSSFHDVSSGNNGYFSGYSFNAEPGYDLVTGWGSPNGQALIDAFAPPTSSGFELSATPNTLSISPGTTLTVSVTIHDLGSFSAPVALSISGLPSGVTGSFSPVSTTTSSILTLTAGTSMLGGIALARIRGTADSLTASTGLSLTINAPLSVLSITSPAVPAAPVVATTFKPGATIGVSGSLVGAFQNLSIQWAEGASPSGGWSTAGVSLNLQSSSGTVINQLLGTWDTSSITTADYFTIQLSGQLSGTTYTASTIVYLDPNLASQHWPKWFNAFSNENMVPISILDSNQNNRLLLETDWWRASQDTSQMRDFSGDGTSVLSLPFSEGGTFSSSPAAGNLNMMAGDDLVGADGNGVLIYHSDYSTQRLTPDFATYGYLLFLPSQPILTDIDNDSLLEVVAMGHEGNDGVGGANAGTPEGVAYLFAWKNTGQVVSNFPIVVPDENLLLTYYNVPRYVIGDVNGDGSKELVVIAGTSATTITPLMFDSHGNQLPWQAPTIGFPCQLSMADLDHNGMLETIIFECGGTLHVLQPDGSERPGWPHQVAYAIGSVTVGDLYQDGQEEIVLCSGDIHIYHTDGTEITGPWPMLGNYNLSTEFFYTAAILADINGDGYPEIITSVERAVTNGPSALPAYMTAQLVALDRFGNTVGSWNLPGAGPSSTPGEFVYPVVGDFNNDGLAEIAVQYGLVNQSGGAPTTEVTMFSTGRPFNPSANDWPMLYQNSQGTSVLRRAAAPSITLDSSSNPSSSGQGPTFTLTVTGASPGSNQPTGIGNLLDGATNVGACVLSNGSCTISPSLAIGNHTLTGGYVGDKNFSDALSSPLNEVIVNSTTAAPSFSPAQGTYTTPQSVTIFDSTPGAVIYYTTDGSTPTIGSPVYGGPMTVSAIETIQAMATSPGYSDSVVASASYVVLPPVILPLPEPAPPRNSF